MQGSGRRGPFEREECQTVADALSLLRTAFTFGLERVGRGGLMFVVVWLFATLGTVARAQQVAGAHAPACLGHGHARRCPEQPLVGSRVEVVLTTGDMSQALAREPSLTFEKTAPRGAEVIRVHDARKYQAFLGAGAAITDASGWLIHTLGTTAQANLMKSLFGDAGLGLNFVRLPIGASDFTVGGVPYTYDDLAPGLSDPLLLHFSIEHDESYIIPTMREALALKPGMLVLASPWSAPAWMKTNDRLDNLGDSGGLRTSAYDSFARYLVKFVLAYQRSGIPISAVTPQNEPGNPTAYPGMAWDEPGEAAFVRFHLAPALRRAGLRTGIYGYDEGWDADKVRFAVRLARSRAAADLAGLASHCYFGAPTVMSTLHHDNPRLIQIVSECSPGITPYSTSELEIAATRNWASAVALWNLALDPSGGPVQSPNAGCPACTGVVTINPVSQTVTRTIDYYELGQLSKFVSPGAVRIATDHFVSYRYAPATGSIASPGLDDVAFRNPNGTDALLAYNGASVPVNFAVEAQGSYATYGLAPNATATLIWRADG